MMARVHTAQEKSFELIEHVAIAITSTPDGLHQHIGILHKDETTSEIRLLHLAWHHILKSGEPKPSYIWIAPAIPAKRARQVAAFCRKVYRANASNGIPYAFSKATDCFDLGSGEFIFGSTRLGLTCASFVLGVFHSTGLPLIEYETWPVDRDGDREWQQFVLTQLQVSASPNHILQVTSEIGLVRYRPEEVAGAATLEKLPATFLEVLPISESILLKLSDWRAN